MHELAGLFDALTADSFAQHRLLKEGSIVDAHARYTMFLFDDALLIAEHAAVCTTLPSSSAAAAAQQLPQYRVVRRFELATTFARNDTSHDSLRLMLIDPSGTFDVCCDSHAHRRQVCLQLRFGSPGV